jgi:hypothetical protein
MYTQASINSPQLCQTKSHPKHFITISQNERPAAFGVVWKFEIFLFFYAESRESTLFLASFVLFTLFSVFYFWKHKSFCVCDFKSIQLLVVTHSCSSKMSNLNDSVDTRNWDFKARSERVDLFGDDLDKTSATDFFNRKLFFIRHLMFCFSGTNGLGSPEYYLQKRIKDQENKENAKVPRTARGRS